MVFQFAEPACTFVKVMVDVGILASVSAEELCLNDIELVMRRNTGWFDLSSSRMLNVLHGDSDGDGCIERCLVPVGLHCSINSIIDV